MVNIADWYRHIHPQKVTIMEGKKGLYFVFISYNSSRTDSTLAVHLITSSQAIRT